MKKSNKLLLGGFLTLMVLIAGVHVAIYAKYKSGDYTIYKPQDKDERESMRSFPNVSVVSIHNISGVVIEFGDVLELEKGKEEFVQFVQQGDSLVITSEKKGAQLNGRNQLRLTIPHNVTLRATNSFINFEKGKDDTATNPIIYLQNSHAEFVATMKPIRLGHAKLIMSDNSIAAFQGNPEVKHLEMKLENSSLDYNGGEIGQLTIETDSISRLMLQSKHLLKAKISPVSNNP